ncbi:rhamnose ABC transporter substrate-binding protein [Acrocarpospora catenulata]|uniref:rhamnose ABC transporter substrate-binding protein n=1 Tax=Acrocarpospora catenulata TaxID=2836182 RepID=UPI001BDAF3F7|nr:rhamnose ABC transporter substrate-binding protein [Acrocarpospora catenulata]
MVRIGMMIPRRQAVTTVVIAVAVAVAATACSADSPPTDDRGSGHYSIAFVPKNLGNPYFVASATDGKAAVEEFGGEFQEVAPSQPTPTGQVPFLNTLMQQGVDGIAMAAVDPKAPCDAMNQARRTGTKVVTFDSDTDPTCRDLFINSATAEGIAKAQVDIISEQIGGAGEVAIISGAPNAPTQNKWIDLMKKDIAANHPGIEVVDVVYGNDDDQQAYDKIAGLVTKYPALKGIIAPDTVAIAAGGRYLQKSEHKGKIALTGLGLPNQMKPYVMDGTVTKFALWNPGDLGYLAAHALKALIDGTITGKQGDKFQAGKLGEYEVGQDGMVLLGQPTLFTKDNIGDFNF